MIINPPTHYRWWKDPPPEHIMQDREALLKYELALIQREYMVECQPIIKALAEIQSMKPMPPIFVNIDLLSEDQKTAILRNIPTKLGDEK